MTQSVAAFRDVRVAAEDTTGNGTKEDTAVQRLHGVLTCPLGGPILHRPMENVASLAIPRRTVIIGEELPLSFEGDCTFEQIVYILQSIMALNAGTQLNSHYSWQFEPSVTTYKAPKSLTFQFGDNVEQFDVEYCVANSIAISGAMNEAVKVKADYFGRNFEATDWTPSTLASPTVLETMLVNKTRFYQGAPGANVFNEELAATLLDFSLNIDPGHRPLKYGSATNYFDALSQVPWVVTLDMTLLFNTGVNTQSGYWRAGTCRQFGIKTVGTSNREMRVAFTGVYTKFESLEEQDGAGVVSVTITAQYDAAWPTAFVVVIQNLLTNLDTVNP